MDWMYEIATTQCQIEHTVHKTKQKHINLTENKPINLANASIVVNARSELGEERASAQSFRVLHTSIGQAFVERITGLVVLGSAFTIALVRACRAAIDLIHKYNPIQSNPKEEENTRTSQQQHKTKEKKTKMQQRKPKEKEKKRERRGKKRERTITTKTKPKQARRK